MAVSVVNSYGLLNRWQIRMTERIWAFNQADDGLAVNAPTVYIQDERDMMAEALRHAFNQAAYHLGYAPRPVYGSQTIHFVPGRDWRDHTLSLDVGHLIAFGSRSTTLIDADATVTYSDTDSDGVDDTGTITLSDVASVDTDDVQIFFRTSDGAPGAADERYAIPIQSISKSGSTITITVHRAHCVKPSFWALYPFTSANPNDRRDADRTTADNFITAVDAYTVTTSSTGAVTLLSKPLSGETTNTETSATGVITDAEQSEFVLRIASGSSTPSVPPYAVRVNYQAGRALENNEMFYPLETAIIRLANTNTLLEHGMFAFEIRDLWRGDSETLWRNNYIPPEYINPLGLKRGHLEAWLTLRTYANRVKGFVD